MKRLGEGMSVHIVSSVKRSILSSLSFSKRPVTRTPIFRSSALPVSIVLGVLLIAMTVSPSMRGMFTRGGSVTAFTESISIFQSDCTTPATDFTWTDTVCAKVTGAPFPNQRRLVWVAPNGAIAKQTAVTSDPQTDTFSLDIPVGDSFRQPGTWTVRTINNDADGLAVATLVVHDTTPKADLSVSKSGPSSVRAGDPVQYTLFVFNAGPDAAVNVTLTEPTPPNTTFTSETQDLGPTFTCSGTGPRTCTISSLDSGAQALFTFTYTIGAGTPVGTVITNTATVSSDTADPRQVDNSSTAEATVEATNPSSCTVDCPSSITVDSDPNQCSAVVTYSTPTASGACSDPESGQTPAVVCSPPSGSTFPVGTTSVTCASGGNSCSFSVTVHDTRPPSQPTIACPSNVTVGEDSPESGSATVNYAAPATTGNCVTTVCDPPSGSSFNVGTTTVDCTATDSSNNIVSCSFTVTVTSGAACTLACPDDVTQTAAAGQCSAVVSYPATGISGNCGTVTCTPASESMFPVGTTPVTCTSSEGPSCTFTVIINAPAAPTITACASNQSVPAGASCEGVIPNLLAEVVVTGCGVTKSQSPTAGSVVSAGIYTVTITAENSVGEATCTATVTVADTTPPVITSSCPVATVASANSNCQAPVPNVTGGVTATDNCTDAVSLTTTQSPVAGTLVGVGTTTITITVKDASNNSTACTTTFAVNDVTPPTISCPASVSATAALGQSSMAVTFSPAVTDNCSGATAVCVPPSGSVFQLGVTTVSCTAIDASSNQAGCTFNVAVSGTLLATADSFLRDGADNTNEGGDDLLRIQSSGHNRVLARFNTSGISTVGLQSATLTLNITDNSDNWGSSGRLVDANRLLADWTEGNGHTIGSQANFRGTGEGVTWKCAKDGNIANQNDDCTSPWNGGTFAATTAAPVLHTNNQLGDVSWNVTADVIAGAGDGWVIKKQNEGQNGQVKYYSKEGAVSAGNPHLGPRLVLVYQP